MPCADRRETLRFRLCDLHTGVKFRPPPVDQPREIQGNARRRATSITVISYGNTLHGFTNPAADGSMMRAALCNEQADRRSWASMKSLFDEVLT
jgi:dienelactone hydrolase